MIHILITDSDGHLSFSLHNSAEEAFHQAQVDVTELTSGDVIGASYPNTLALGAAIASSVHGLSFTIAPAFDHADLLACEADGHAILASEAVISSGGNPLITHLHPQR